MASYSSSIPDFHPADRSAWKQVVEKYQQPSTWRTLWQLTNTFVPYLLLWYLMYLSLAVSWWLTMPLAVLAGAFLVRIFIIFHDCGHGSLFKSRRANDIVGFIAGVLTLTPYYQWRWGHAIHHNSAGKLDQRGMGDVWTMTVQEYLESSRGKRFAYSFIRNPFVLLVLGPVLMFVIMPRFPSPQAPARERHSVWWTNLALLCWVVALSWIFGIKAYLLIQLTIVMVGGAAGVWMFYVQHQFESVYWERGDKWDYTATALQGSSFYKLPKILQWFTGSIGFHHIHHLSTRIPNYYLQKCHEADPLFQQVQPITLFSSLHSLTLRLWDEKTRRLVGYGRMRELRRAQRERSTLGQPPR
ncbi:MAG: fatty acid desaturase [Nevskiales bacterium]